MDQTFGGLTNLVNVELFDTSKWNLTSSTIG